MPNLIDLKIDDREITSRLESLAWKSGNLAPVMREIAGDMLYAVQENFALEGRPDRWPELSPAYKRRLTKKGKTGKMLNRSAAGLYQSIQSLATDAEAVVGTNKVYAAIHHFGGAAGRGRRANIPARPYMLLDDPDTRKIVERMKRYLGEE